MTSAETHFIKSALPVKGTLFLTSTDDTSLAMPPEGMRGYQNDRSSRVQQQVQLTLARKGKRATSNGSLHLSSQHLPDHAHTFGSVRGLQSSVKQVNVDLRRDSSWVEGMRRPSRRVEVSPASSPETLRSSMGHPWLRHAHTLPNTRASLMDRTQVQGPPRGYARSEILPNKKVLPLSSVRCHVRSHSLVQGSLSPSGEALQLSQSPGALQYSGMGGSRQTWEASRWGASLRRQKSLHTSQPPESFAIFTSKMGSHPASVVSMEVDSLVRQEAVPLETTEAEGQQGAGKDVDMEVAGRKSEGQVTELTLERAVSLLNQGSTKMQISATNYVQHQCFVKSEAKKRVAYLKGIPRLIKLWQSDSVELQRAVSGALRNIVFENDDNKMEVKDSGGIQSLLRLLKATRDIETRKQLTGLLWNLSSHDLLKDVLAQEALQTVTDTVVIPYSGLSDDCSKDDLLVDPDVFCNVTGCLRNMSSAGPEVRRTMRECPFLIDSLVHYVRGTIADYKPDDKSTENCVCILHNLSYQMEAELPKHSDSFHETRQNLATKTKTPGCFGSKSRKIIERAEQCCPLLEEKSNARGVEWLWNPITVRMHLSLMARSTRRCTQEAAVGALQNITAGNGTISHAIAYTIVRRENGLQQVKRMLQDGEPEVKRTAVSLLRNVSRYRELHADIVNQVLPELMAVLPNANGDADPSGEGSLFQSVFLVLINLSQGDAQNVRAIANQGGLAKVIHLSSKDNGYGPTKTAQAASVLLHIMWGHSELHGAYRKAGYKKTDFINSRTVKAANSARD